MEAMAVADGRLHHSARKICPSASCCGLIDLAAKTGRDWKLARRGDRLAGLK
jgi:hypothetical protein